ncbi:hypothetical protein [Marinifilum caeruleilacunae]|uniref:Uncharacterized protein n=1 Tax=Marinifilum caeruleilacunae TaxID=2499076 RepID=A0ABX1WU02_9BACT|nr:hypothetical protein [Marinifilum caeruleilacunae]NOU59589.1 hypothetical protein [Marinifilum caeruleilacunae]
MDKLQAEQEKEFIKKIFIDEIGRLQSEGFHFFSFIMMGQAIEALGCFLDNKPLKARAQSSKRFSKSLNILMGNDYRKVNKDHWLYDRLRNQLTHSFVPSKSLLLCSRANQPEAEHLEWLDDRLVLVAEEMYEDLVKGCNKLFGMIDKGKVPLKKIAASPEELGIK